MSQPKHDQEANPYAAPQVESEADIGDDGKPIAMGIDVEKKVKAIIRDAKQFWIAIICCFLCTPIACAVVIPWYFNRLKDWSKMAEADPKLVQKDSPYGATAKQFRSAKTKLKIGVGFACFCGIIVAINLITRALPPR